MKHLTDKQYILAAQRLFTDEGEIEVDDDSGTLPKGRVSRSEDQDGEQGAYVMAWVYVPKEEAAKELNRNTTVRGGL